MKNKLLLLFISLVLFGCNDAPPLSQKGLDRNTWLYSTEISYVMTSVDTSPDKTREGFESMWLDFATSAKYKRNLSDAAKEEMRNKPFCDILPAVRILDFKIKKKYNNTSTVQEIFESINGFSLEESCGRVVVDKPISRTVIIDNSVEISPETYGQLIESARTCERARNSLLSFPMGHVFTKEDYNTVMGLINGCKRYELEEAVNSR